MYPGRIIFFLAVLFYFSLGATAQEASDQYIYVDRNYQEVERKRDAVMKVRMSEDADSVRFWSWSIRPESLIEKGSYKKGDGFANSLLNRYWPNGNLKSSGRLKNLQQEGRWLYYDESGTLYSEVNYEAGRIQGKAIRYYSTGKIRHFIYSENKKNGESRLFDAEGKLQELKNYKDDSLHGVSFEYFQTGSLRRKTIYNFGYKVTDTLFWENGKPYSCEKYNSFGVLHGRSMMFSLNGKMQRYDDYDNGILVQNLCLISFSSDNADVDDCPVRLKEAQYPGGLGKFLDYVAVNQDYPDEAIDWKQQGIVYVEFTVSSDGSIGEVTTENLIPLGYGLEAECLRLLRQIRYFEPRKLSGRTFPARLKLPFLFILQQ